MGGSVKKYYSLVREESFSGTGHLEDKYMVTRETVKISGVVWCDYK
jgi:hypothetical protein